jgi:hypothetical protein
MNPYPQLPYDNKDPDRLNSYYDQDRHATQ